MPSTHRQRLSLRALTALLLALPCAGAAASATHAETPPEIQAALDEIHASRAAQAPPDDAPATSTDAPPAWHPVEPDDAEAWRVRIALHAPPDIEVPEGFVPPNVRTRAWQKRAELHEVIADWPGAAHAFAHLISIGTHTPAAWRGLGRARFHNGDIPGAEAAFLAALDLARRPDTGWRQPVEPVHRELGELYLAADWPDAAIPHLEIAAASRIEEPRGRGLLALALARSGGEAAPEELVARVPLWPPTRTQRWRHEIGAHIDAAVARLPDDVRGRFEGESPARLATVLALIAAFVVLMAPLLRRMRKCGDLTVKIAFPDELDGCFDVQLSTRKGQNRRPASTGGTGGERKSSALRHFSVGRETQFLRVPVKHYWVTISGSLRDPASGALLSEPYEEHAVQITSKTTTRLEVNLAPRECPVDVKVRWDKKPASDFGASALGHPSALRFGTNGSVRLRLPMGSHTIVVGSGDRIAECDVEVQSFQPTPVEVNLAGSESLVFKGCPPAVEPYLHGDLSAAARALENDGHTQVAHLLIARLHQEQGQTERAAERLESAGHTLEAAKLRESMSDWGRAAELFEHAGNASQAAATYRTAGDFRKAGELFLSLSNFDEAATCFEEAGALDSLVGVLEAQGKYFDGARVALEAGDRAQSIRLLQQVGRNDPTYPEACIQLVEALEAEGHVDLAAAKLEEFIKTTGASGASPELHSHLAELLVEAEEHARALEVLEGLREREPTHPNIASRIESLRKIISGRRLEDDGAGSKPTVVSGDQRYEIIEEIGRGGMGLIFRARDRRLKRTVALKRLPENLREHPKALRLFFNEAQAAARLNHPNIVTVFDADQEDGTFFITMELLEGHPLNAVLAQRGRIGPKDCARIGVQVAKGLQYAHNQQIVHRDIKTANLFLTTDRVVKIMDFGLAKMMEEVRRGSTVIGGTPSYMAPEQAVGERVDHRADLYALGITLFELATGSVPFKQGDVAYHHRHTPAPDPRSVAQGIPDALAELILELLHKDPAERVSSASEVATRLEAIIAS